MIRAVIFDFNGVLVDDEHVHFELFREVLAAERVVISERDYHERYLGLDDRGCFEAALSDAGQDADRRRVDALIARKAGRYVEVALLVGIVAAVSVPLYAWRHVLIARFRHRSARPTEGNEAALRPDR